MLARVLRIIPVMVGVLTVAIVSVQHSARTLNDLPPLEIFQPCASLCWQQIQPGVTPMSDGIDILQARGITNLRPFSGEYIYSGLAIKTDNERDEYDVFITTATPEMIVDQITVAQDVCSHVALAALGKPTQILRATHTTRSFVYVFEVDADTVVIFRNRPGDSMLIGAGLLSATGYRHLYRLSLNQYNTVGWHDVESILRQPCEA
ncbi:MAG: hypothetical protein AAFV33_01710 [Chloroflexota bacterium]